MLKQEPTPIIVKFYRGFSDETRLSILETLVSGEKTVSQIVGLTKQSQSNVSNHLRCLSECGLTKNRRDKKNIYYSLRDVKVKKLLVLSEQIISKVAEEITGCFNYKS